jgi:hypothetical protein
VTTFPAASLVAGQHAKSIDLELPGDLGGVFVG